MVSTKTVPLSLPEDMTKTNIATPFSSCLSSSDIFKSYNIVIRYTRSEDLNVNNNFKVPEQGIAEMSYLDPEILTGDA